MNVISLKGPPLIKRIELAITTLLDLIKAGWALQITLSGGKDSSTSALLCLEAIRRAKAAGIRQADHFVTSSDTSVENPVALQNLLTMHEEIEQWVEEQDLPVTLHVVQPNLAAKFVVSTVGRGTLPRYVENGGRARACSEDWKKTPQTRLAKALAQQANKIGCKGTIAILGTRTDESAVRAAGMAQRGDNHLTPTANDEGQLTLSIIADWTEDMVWEFLCSFLDKDLAPYQAFATEGAIRRLLDFYTDANESTCGMLYDNKHRAPCGARSGCWVCGISGPRDRSMESLLASDPKYGFMQGLNDFRNHLLDIQWDMSKRELVGRTISPVGYLQVRPDVFHLSTRRNLLAYLITLDVLEQERAEEFDGRMARGELPDTPENQRLRHPQFENVTPQDLVAIDFYWSMHHYAQEAFPALRVWYDIRRLGRRYIVPKLERAPAIPIPERRWYKVGAYDLEAPADGLRNYHGELWGPYRHVERALHYRQVDGGRTGWFEEEPQFEVDAQEANAFVQTFCEGALPIETQFVPAMESARFWLDEGIVRLPKSMAAKYQEMARRGQYFNHLAQKLNVTPAELDLHLQKHSITDEQHEKLLRGNESDMQSRPAPQLELFAA